MGALSVDNYLLELSPSSCLSKWAGEAERRIQAFFMEAKRRSPSILFLDEFDALAMKRESAEDVGARRVLSELLIQLTSIQASDRITIIASTNRVSDLDPAVVRRFQKMVEVPLPSMEERERIIQKGLCGITHQLSPEDFHFLSESTQGWSGSLLQVSMTQLFDGLESHSRGCHDARARSLPIAAVQCAVIRARPQRFFAPMHSFVKRYDGNDGGLVRQTDEGQRVGYSSGADRRL